jgi:hypothetical protein
METRAMNATTTLEHVLTVVLGNPEGSDLAQAGPYRRALEQAGVTDIGDFVMLRDEDFREIKIPEFSFVTNPEGETKVTQTFRGLRMVERRTFEQLRLWFRHMSQEWQDLVSPSSVWFLLMTNDFAKWKSTNHASLTNDVLSISGEEKAVVTSEDKKDKGIRQLQERCQEGQKCVQGL